jgi:hypothetical protein
VAVGPGGGCAAAYRGGAVAADPGRGCLERRYRAAARTAGTGGRGLIQSKVESWFEASANTASGFVVSYLLWALVVVPMYALPVTPAQNLVVVSLFTVASIVRSYVWRRFFNAELHRVIHHWLRGNT